MKAINKYNILLVCFLFLLSLFIAKPTYAKVAGESCTIDSECDTGTICKNETDIQIIGQLFVCVVGSRAPATNPATTNSSIFGVIVPPVTGYSSDPTGLMKFANNILKLIITGAGLFAFFNFIIAGFTFLGASGDPKKAQQAWEKIYMSLIGLLFVAGSFVLAAVFGWILFKDATAILSPKIYGP